MQSYLIAFVVVLILVSLIEYEGKPLLNFKNIDKFSSDINFTCNFTSPEFWRITAIITSAAILFALVEIVIVNVCLAIANKFRLFESDEPAKLDSTYTPKLSLDQYEKQK